MPGEGRIRIVCQRAGQETRIVITDDGPGMSEEVMAHAVRSVLHHFVSSRWNRSDCGPAIGRVKRRDNRDRIARPAPARR